MLLLSALSGPSAEAGERPPRPLLLFIAEQIEALSGAIEDYLAAERNRRRHAAELQDRLGFRAFARVDADCSPTASASRRLWLAHWPGWW